jgi:hypothetical protein
MDKPIPKKGKDVIIKKRKYIWRNYKGLLYFEIYDDYWLAFDKKNKTATSDTLK